MIVVVRAKAVGTQDHVQTPAREAGHVCVFMCACVGRGGQL